MMNKGMKNLLLGWGLLFALVGMIVGMVWIFTTGPEWMLWILFGIYSIGFSIWLYRNPL